MECISLNRINDITAPRDPALTFPISIEKGQSFLSLVGKASAPDWWSGMQELTSYPASLVLTFVYCKQTPMPMTMSPDYLTMDIVVRARAIPDHAKPANPVKPTCAVFESIAPFEWQFDYGGNTRLGVMLSPLLLSDKSIINPSIQDLVLVKSIDKPIL